MAETQPKTETAAPVAPPPAPTPPVSEPIVKIPAKPVGSVNAMSKLDKLRQHVTTQANTATEEQPVEETAPTTFDTDTPLEANALKDVWAKYIQWLGETAKMGLSVIYKNATYTIKSSTIIELTLASQHEREMVEEDKMNIIPFLRSRLKNGLIDFEFVINQTIQSNRPFTAEDRFKVMAESNPVLNDLRNSLGLELEY